MDDPNSCPRPENTVFYRLFPSSTGQAATGLQHDLTCLAVKCTELANGLAKDHVWHYEPFRLGVRPPGAQEQSTYPPHLCGHLCYRDNIEDEWLVVYLLSEISKCVPNLVISVSDDDGEFLLIEAAHCLPGWLQPETAQNRVFLYRGAVHIIPRPLTPADVTCYPVATPTLQEAVDLVVNPMVPTQASEAVQEAIQLRTSCFPDAMNTNQHRAHCYVPWPVGHVMSCDQTLVAAAVHALCDRDAGDMKAIKSMRHFSPSSHSSLMTSVTFTRCLYAKLLHQRFNPPPHSGFSRPSPTSPTHQAYELGMKLTCGLEMLVCAVGGTRGDKSGVQRDISTDPRWIKFLQTLQEKDYFQGELQGSRQYQNLLTAAREYFMSNVMDHTEGREGEDGEHRDPLRAAGHVVVQILTSDPGREEEVIQKNRPLPPPDSDEWMRISPGELDAMMKKAAGYMPQGSNQTNGGEVCCSDREGPSKGAEGKGADRGPNERGQGAEKGPNEGGQGAEKGPNEGAAVKSVVHGIKSFVNTISSHEGAELPWSSVDGRDRVEFDTATVLRMLEGMMTEGEEGAHGDEVMSESSESGEEEEEMREIMEQMDQELKASGFKSSLVPGDGGQDDLNLAHNLLSSLSAQPEAAGPASNILHSLGIPVPDPDQNGTQTDSSSTPTS